MGADTGTGDPGQGPGHAHSTRAPPTKKDSWPETNKKGKTQRACETPPKLRGNGKEGGGKKGGKRGEKGRRGRGDGRTTEHPRGLAVYRHPGTPKGRRRLEGGESTSRQEGEETPVPSVPTSNWLTTVRCRAGADFRFLAGGKDFRMVGSSRGTLALLVQG